MKAFFKQYFIEKEDIQKLAVFSAILLLLVACQLCVPWLLGFLIDKVIAKKQTQVLIFFLILIFIAFASMYLEQYSNIFIAKITSHWKRDLRFRLLDAWCLQEPDEAEKWQLGEAGMKFTRDITIIGEAFQTVFPQLVKSVFMFLLAYVFAYQQCRQIGVIFLFILPIILIIYYYFRYCFQHLVHCLRYIQDNFFSKIFEFLNSYSELKALGEEKHYQENIGILLLRINDKEYENTGKYIAFQRCISVLLFFFEYGTLGVACYLACHGRMQPGEIIAFQIMLMRVLNSSVGFLNFLPQLTTVREAQVSLWSFMENLSGKGEGDAKHLIDPISEIELVNISFAYHADRRHVLNNYSLRIKQGEIIALEGCNGVGKTTLWKLLVGWMKPTIGTILINNLPINSVLSDYRKRIAFVTQHTLLFYGSLLENITLGETDISQDQMSYALRVSGFDKVLERFPEGLEKRLEHNASLSGGECQRLALARALYRQPEILILDEVTNHLDASGKLLVKNLINEMRGKIIMLVISHDSEIRSLCDRRVALI